MLQDTSTLVAANNLTIFNIISFMLKLELGFCPIWSYGLNIDLLMTGPNNITLVTDLK